MATKRPLRILQINTSDSGGGAEGLSLWLHQTLLQDGHEAQLFVGEKQTKLPHIHPLSLHPWKQLTQSTARSTQRAFGGHRCGRALTQAVRIAGNPRRLVAYQTGKENFHHPATAKVFDRFGHHKPDIVILHNLHGHYFDLRCLPMITQRVPTIAMLHDAWLMAGHCAHALDCDRWQTGCGQCPQLQVPIKVAKDQTASNWTKKQSIYRQSRLHVASPAQWMLNKAQASILQPAIESLTLLRHGIDTNTFCPGDQASARQSLGLPLNRPILMFAAIGAKHNPWKDAQTLAAACESIVQQIAPSQPKPLLLTVGDSHRNTSHPDHHQVGTIRSAKQMAMHLQASDIYVHAAKVDTSPLTILEAMACGLPVIGSSVGGIPEQITHEQTGLLVPPSNPQAMANALSTLLSNRPRRTTMSQNSREHVLRLHQENQAKKRWMELFKKLSPEAFKS